MIATITRGPYERRQPKRRSLHNGFRPIGILTWWDFVYLCWMERACWVCGKFGKCRHREPAAESVEEFSAALRARRKAS